MAQKTAEPEDIVKLKPIFGIKPGVYLTALYSFILILILFWLFVSHGLANYGTVLEIKTEPAGAAVRVNGVYLGVSGTKIPLPNSIKPMTNVIIEVSLPGFEPESGTHQIPGRVFGTRFFPRVYKLEYALQTRDPAAVLAKAASEYAEWTFGGEPTEAWQVPLVLSEAAYQLAISNEQLTMCNEILLAAARFTVTRAALRDITRAKFLLDNGGNAPSPAAAINSMRDILAFLSENPQSAEWLAGLLPPESAKIVRESNWFKNESYAAERLARAYDPPFLQSGEWTGSAAFSGLLFTGANELMFSETPVPRTLFEAFLNENPNWNNQYIDYFENASEPATGMSYYAAEAFCAWLSGRLPAGYERMEVRLPSADEWLYAYDCGLIDTESRWEWTSSPFAPLDFNANPGAILAVSSPEKEIFNGVSKPNNLSRASLPPDFCSPVVTFRPVIAVSN